MAIQKPEYKLIIRERSFELREYRPYLSLQVTIKASDYNEAASRGFSPLANYIFGGNISKTKIAMTAPVSAQPKSERIAMTSPVTLSGDGEYTVEFFIPRKYTLDTLPTPLDDRITFHAYPTRRMAVVRFSGRFNQENFEKNIHLLNEWIHKEGFNEKGEPIIAGYDPPFTPWFMKHNEVLIEVAV
jgi:hypothetical protein